MILYDGSNFEEVIKFIHDENLKGAPLDNDGICVGIKNIAGRLHFNVYWYSEDGIGKYSVLFCRDCFIFNDGNSLKSINRETALMFKVDELTFEKLNGV